MSNFHWVAAILSSAPFIVVSGTRPRFYGKMSAMDENVAYIWGSGIIRDRFNVVKLFIINTQNITSDNCKGYRHCGICRGDLTTT